MTIKLKNINNELVIYLDGRSFSFDEEEYLVAHKQNGSDIENVENTYFDEETIKKLEAYKQSGKESVFIEVEGDNVAYSSLLGAKIFSIAKELKTLGLKLDFAKLGDEIRKIVEIAFKDTGNKAPEQKNENKPFIVRLGEVCYEWFIDLKSGSAFIKETVISVVNFIGGTAIFRKKDFCFAVEDCSYKAVPIIALVSFLVGLIIAFVGAIQLRSFGAEIYVASMVSIGMTRIMAAIMVGIVMAGRTGSSFAATLGTMQVNEEIDALKTLGIKITEYLVAPRVIALVLTIPFLTILADILGMFGGAIVGVLFLGISSSSYLEYSLNALSLNNVLIGVFHSFIYGIIIAVAGCYEGINVGRDADSVGSAATKSVVKSLVLMIIATGIITVALEVMGL